MCDAKLILLALWDSFVQLNDIKQFSKGSKVFRSNKF